MKIIKYLIIQTIRKLIIVIITISLTLIVSNYLLSSFPKGM